MTRTPITAEIIAELKRLHKETGKGSMTILKGRKDRPSDLHSETIQGWMSGKSKSAKTSHLEYVLDIWRNADPLIPWTQDMIDHYIAEIERTGVKNTTLCRMLESVDVHLKPNMLSRRLMGRNKSISKAEYETTTNLLKSLPNSS